MVFGNKVGADVETDKTGGLGCNAVNRPAFDSMRALIGEIMGTFILVITVLETAVNPLTLANRGLACLAIGISVFLVHCVLINVDGCSINPTRSFGPMVVRLMVYPERKDEDMGVGPLDLLAWTSRRSCPCCRHVQAALRSRDKK